MAVQRFRRGGESPLSEFSGQGNLEFRKAFHAEGSTKPHDGSDAGAASSPDFGDGRGKDPFRVLQDVFADLPLCWFQRRESCLNVNEQGTLMGIVLLSRSKTTQTDVLSEFYRLSPEQMWPYLVTQAQATEPKPKPWHKPITKYFKRS